MTSTAPHRTPATDVFVDGLVTHDGQAAASLFALSTELRHLNHGSFGAPTLRVLDAQDELRRAAAAAPVEWFGDLPSRIGSARAEVAGWLGVPEHRVAFVPNASAGASVVLGALDLPTGCEIVVTDHGYGAVTMAAQRVAARVGGTVVVAPVELGADASRAAEAVLSAFTDRTALVVVDQVTSPTARELPVAAICRAARERGVVSLVDGAHSPMLLVDPVERAEADYWVGNLHKFASAGHGVAVVAVREGLGQELWPLIDSWGATLPFPQRFDHQGTQELSAWVTAPLALAEIEDRLGWERVRGYATGLADRAEALVGDAMLSACGVGPTEVGTPVSAMRLVALPDGLVRSTDDANALRSRVLHELGIEVAFASWRDRGFLRLSCHAYNTLDDYADLADRAVPLLARLSRDLEPGRTFIPRPTPGTSTPGAPASSPPEGER